MRNCHERHFVLFSGCGIEFGQSGLVGSGNLRGCAFQNDDVITGFEVNREGGIVSQVAGFAGGTAGSKVKNVIEEKTQTGMVCGRPSGRVVQIQ
jgi:hypothetical protein